MDSMIINQMPDAKTQSRNRMFLPAFFVIFRHYFKRKGKDETEGNRSKRDNKSRSV